MTGTTSALNGAPIGLNNAVNDRNRSVAGRIKELFHNMFDGSVAGGVSYYAAQRELNRNVGSQLAQRA